MNDRLADLDRRDAWLAERDDHPAIWRAIELCATGYGWADPRGVSPESAQSMARRVYERGSLTDRQAERVRWLIAAGLAGSYFTGPIYG